MSQHAFKNKDRIRVNNKIIAAFIVTLAYFKFCNKDLNLTRRSFLLHIMIYSCFP